MDAAYLNKINDIYRDYVLKVNPLMAAIGSRLDKKQLPPKNLYNEIRAINDHLARCYESDDNKFIEKQIDAANRHLIRLKLDQFKMLNALISQRISKFEKYTISEFWMRINNSQFWPKYRELSLRAYQTTIEAKTIEPMDSTRALEIYEQAYNYYALLDKLFIDNRKGLYLSFFYRLLKIEKVFWWLLCTFVGSVIAMIIAHIIK